MSGQRPLALTLAGFDPSGGAGLLADVMTFRSLDVDGVAVCTAITVQHENRFDALDWVADERVFDQLGILLEAHDVAAVKVGLLRGPEILREVLDRLDLLAEERGAAIPVVWDPVLHASVGRPFHPGGWPGWREQAARVRLFTPNLPEMAALAADSQPDAAAVALSRDVAVYLKGGHDPVRPGHDRLYEQGRRTVFPPGPGDPTPKHGSGCVFAAAAAAGLARGETIRAACETGKRYVHDFLMSSSGSRGWHARRTARPTMSAP